MAQHPARECTEYSSQNPTALFTPLFSLNVFFQAFLLIESLLLTPIIFSCQELCLVQNKLFFLPGVFPPKSVHTVMVDTQNSLFYAHLCCMTPADTAFTANSIRMENAERLLSPLELCGMKPYVCLFSITYPKYSKINSWASQNYGSCSHATVTSQFTSLQFIVYTYSLQVYCPGYRPSGFGLLSHLPQSELNISLSRNDGI